MYRLSSESCLHRLITSIFENDKKWLASANVMNIRDFGNSDAKGLLALFAGDDGFNVVEFIECLHRREVVDVEVKDLVANLAQHRVVELEKRELVAATLLSHLGKVFGHGLLVAIIILELA